MSIHIQCSVQKLALIIKKRWLACTFIYLIFLLFQARRLMSKLDIYRKFTNALGVTIVLSVAGICYEVFPQSSY
jgi:hypothetical protein